jgi:hypothetical protein
MFSLKNYVGTINSEELPDVLRFAQDDRFTGLVTTIVTCRERLKFPKIVIQQHLRFA